MNVEDLYRQLSYGELSNLKLAVDATGTIKPDQHPKIIHLANEALTRLYTRFLLSEKQEHLTMVEGQTDYPLTSTDVIRVLAVYTAYGYMLPLNDSRAPDAVSISGRTVRVPIVKKDTVVAPGSELEVVYQAKHPVLVATRLDQEIELDPVLHEALTAYIASKMYMNMNTPEALQAGAQHYARYESICEEAARLGLVSMGSMTNTNKFHDRGWI